MISFRTTKDIKKLLLGVGGAFFLKLASAGGVLFFNIYIARLLGASDAGYFFLAQTFVIIFADISRRGFDNTIVRFIAPYSNSFDSDIKEIYKLAICRVVPLGVFFSGLIFSLSSSISGIFFDTNEFSDVLSVMSLSILPFSLMMLNSFCFQGRKKVSLYMIFNSAGIPYLFCFISLFYPPTSSIEASWIFLVSSICAVTISTIFWVFESGNIGSYFQQMELSGNIRNEILKSSNALFQVALLTLVNLWFSQVVLGYMGTAEEVAIFSSATRISASVAFVLIAVNSIATPKYAESFKHNDLDSVRKTVLFSTRVIFITALPFALLLHLFNDEVMSLFGEDFANSGYILSILLVGQVINSLTGSVGFLLQMSGNENSFRNKIFLSSGFLVVIGPVVISFYGVVGAAFITAFTLSIQNIFFFYDVRKKLDINTLRLL